MSKRNEALAFQTERWQDVGGTDTEQSRGPHPGRSHSQPIGEPRSAANFQPSRVSTSIITVTRIAAQEWLNVMPRQGDEPLRRVTETQARSLLALAICEPICRTRRGEIIALRLMQGVSVAAMNTALRAGMGNQLPIAEDNRTVRRVGKSTFEARHVEAWDDGRETLEQRQQREREAMQRAGLL